MDLKRIFLPAPVKSGAQSLDDAAFRGGDWERLVTPGHVIKARMDALTPVGGKLLLATSLAALCLIATPLILTMGSGEHDKVAVRPVIDSRALLPATLVGLDKEVELAKTEDLHAFVTDGLRSIEKGLPEGCTEVRGIRQSWVQNVNCKAVDKAAWAPWLTPRVWVMKTVDDSGYAKPWLGVYIKTGPFWDRAWHLKQVASDGFATMDDKSIGKVTFEMIAPQLVQDFSDVPVLKDGSEQSHYRVPVRSPSQGEAEQPKRRPAFGFGN